MMTDDELLSVLQDERRRAVGFDNDNNTDLLAAREKGLYYFNGMMPDVPSLPNRSQAVSTDVADNINALLPDLVEILTEGDDVVSFTPHGPEDVDAAEQETDYLRQVIFQQDGSFLSLMTMIQDALQVKTGVVKYWWKKQDEETEELTGLTEEEAAVAGSQSEVVSHRANDDGSYDLTIKRKGKTGTVCFKAWPPEDFAVAADTVLLSSATYSAFRNHPRAQELLAQGVSREIVDQLPAYQSANEGMQEARDTVGEHSLTNGGGLNDLRQVETVEHYIRLEEGGKLQLWRVVTGGRETVLIEKAKVERIQGAAITPYIVTHRFYGKSVADLLIELQKIRTALTRGYLDSMYFGLNQRNEVAMEGANEHTLSDLLRNEPGVPIRVKRTGTVVPVQAGGAGFNALEALEYFSTVAEARTGVMRNAQGLNPDTLHDTAKGAMALMSNAQKRVRMIARIFAETGIKDLYLGVHALLREHSSQQEMKRLRGKWVPVDPSKWGERADMSIEIGVGSGGKEQQMAQLAQESELIQGLVAAQGGMHGPIITAPKLYNFAKRALQIGGCKDPESYLEDPANAPQQPPPPDPKLVEVQARAQLAEQQAQHEAQMDQAKATGNEAIERYKAELNHQLASEKQAAELDLKERTTAAELDLKERQLVAELQLKREQMAVEQQLQREQAEHNAELAQQKTDHGVAMTEKTVSAKIGNPVEAGGEPG